MQRIKQQTEKRQNNTSESEQKSAFYILKTFINFLNHRGPAIFELLSVNLSSELSCEETEFLQRYVFDGLQMASYYNLI